MNKKISILRKMFPQYDRDLIEQILHDKNGNLDNVVNILASF